MFPEVQFGGKDELNILSRMALRYDEKRQVRIKTVEIIVSETPCRPLLRYRDHDIVSVIVPYANTALRDRLKAAGGRWNPDEKYWQVPFGAIRDDIELTEKILE